MWQRFSERARKVVFYAQEEAQKFGEAYVSTEHIVLGLVRDADSTAVEALETLGVDRRRVREEVEKQLPRNEIRGGEDMTLTPRAKQVIDLSYDEARRLGHDYIGTEHLLLGIVREADGLGGRVLAHLGVELDPLRSIVGALSARSPAPERAPVSRSMGIRERFGFGPGREATARLAAAETATENAAIWERCTPQARAIIVRAQQDAASRGATGVGAEHLILALLDDPACRGMRAIATLDADFDRVRRAAEALATVETSGETPEPMPFSPSGQNAVTAAHVVSITMGNPFLGTEHLALVLFGGAAGEFIDPETLHPVRVREAVARSQAEE